MPVRSSLIDPDGGALVDLVAAPDRRAGLRAEADRLPRVRMTPIDLQWAHVLVEGWASPLRGFMREDEYLQTIHFNCIRLPNGGGRVNMSLPIVLAIGDADKDQIGDKPDVALQGPDGGVAAILRRSVRFIYLAFPCLFIYILVRFL
jgi:3'-phosphoadenosine 5'-phosphosulfate synthase